MFNNLLESEATTERGVGGHAFSVVLHCCVIAIAIVLTERVVTAAPPPVDEHLSYVAPEIPPPPPDVARPREVAPAPVALGHQILIAPIDIPDVLPTIDITRPITNADDYTGTGVAGGRHDGVPGVEARPLTGDVSYFAAEVEKPAVQITGTGTPEYPEILRTAGIPGEVRVKFTIDTTGRAEMATLEVVRTTNKLFTDAVKKALPQMRFKPAETGGHKVRQIVEMPFAFTLKQD